MKCVNAFFFTICEGVDGIETGNNLTNERQVARKSTNAGVATQQLVGRNQSMRHFADVCRAQSSIKQSNDVFRLWRYSPGWARQDTNNAAHIYRLLSRLGLVLPFDASTVNGNKRKSKSFRCAVCE